MSERRESRQWLEVAHVLRPRGNKGEVIARLSTDFPARFSHLKQMYLRRDQEPPEARELRNFWLDRNHPGTGIFHFAGCSSIPEAETLRGYHVLLPFEERVTLPAGQYFVTDLIGCTVFTCAGEETRLSSPACEMEVAPRVVGTVRDVFFPGAGVPGTPLLQVDRVRGELLVPLAEDICKVIDVSARRIEVRLPEGLDDLNA